MSYVPPENPLDFDFIEEGYIPEENPMDFDFNPPVVVEPDRIIKRGVILRGVIFK